MRRPNLSRETKFSGANRDREIFIISVQLTTSRFGKLTWLIHTLMTIHAYCTCTFSSTGTYGQGNIHYFCSADHKQVWQTNLVDPYFDDYTCILYLYI